MQGKNKQEKEVYVMMLDNYKRAIVRRALKELGLKHESDNVTHVIALVSGFKNLSPLDLERGISVEVVKLIASVLNKRGYNYKE